MSTPATPDADRRSPVDLLPGAAQPYARLARLDRPIGTWLLFWPCAWGVLLAGHPVRDIYLLPLFFVGALVMRSAGCVYNDIVDRDLDAQVARTKDRPVASGQISVKAAWMFLVSLCLVGLLVLVQLNAFAGMIALASLALVAAYPFMKRITWWPQAWLGLTFNWGALVGYAAATGTLSWGAALLYLGGLCWTLGYDTIYAQQDIEDDAIAGIKSSARRLGDRAAPAVRWFYSLAAVLIGAAAFVEGRELWLAAVTGPWFVILFHFGIRPRMNGSDYLGAFRFNGRVGMIVALSLVTMMLAR